MFFIWSDSNQDEGIHIPGGRLPGVRDMAQSVPVNVPMWSNPRAAKSARDPVVIEVSYREEALFTAVLMFVFIGRTDGLRIGEFAVCVSHLIGRLKSNISNTVCTS